MTGNLRGPNGGYILAAPASGINVTQIVAAAESRLDATRCGSEVNRHHGVPCLAYDLWRNSNETVNDYLGSITLQNVIEQKSYSDGSQVVTFICIH